MSHLRKVCVPLTHGVVAKVTTEGQGSETWVTVEAFHPDEKKAYRFQHFGPVRPKKGDAVLFTGMAKVEHYRGRPRFAKYYHDPMDGSSKADWEFADMIDATCVHVGPWELARTALSVSADLGEVLRGGKGFDVKRLSECLTKARAYVRALEAQVATAKESEVTDSASAP
jgi:hypothetical protein